MQKRKKSLHNLLHLFLHQLLLHLTYFFYRSLSWTWRLEVHVDEQIHQAFERKERFLFALFHEDILPILTKCSFIKPCIILVSSSKDGDILAHLLSKKGFLCARGSSRNKAIESTKALLRMAKLHQANIAFAVDGSKGPRREVKPGIFALSAFLGYNIGCILAQASHKYTFQKSWDQSYLPMPFSRVSISFQFALPKIEKKSYKNKNLPNQLRDEMLRVREKLAKD